MYVVEVQVAQSQCGFSFHRWTSMLSFIVFSSRLKLFQGCLGVWDVTRITGNLQRIGMLGNWWWNRNGIVKHSIQTRVRLKTVENEWVWFYKLGPKRSIQTWAWNQNSFHSIFPNNPEIKHGLSIRPHNYSSCYRVSYLILFSHKLAVWPWV